MRSSQSRARKEFDAGPSRTNDCCYEHEFQIPLHRGPFLTTSQKVVSGGSRNETD